MTWRPVDRDELLRASGGSPVVRLATDDRCLAVASDAGWAYVGPWRPSGHWGGGAFPRAGRAFDPGAADESSALAMLSGLAADRGVRIEWFSTSPGAVLRAPGGAALDRPGLWSFLWIDRLPEQPASEVGLIELDDTLDAEEISTFGRAHNPDFEGFPGRGLATRWVGARDDEGQLLAIGSVHRLATGVAHLAGIVVHADQRGRGLGAAVTEALTSREIEERGVCTLGVYTANAPAVRLYRRLGYEVALDFATRGLPPWPAPAT